MPTGAPQRELAVNMYLMESKCRFPYIKVKSVYRVCVCLSVCVYRERFVSTDPIWFSIKSPKKVELQQMHAHWGTTEGIGSEHVFNGE